MTLQMREWRFHAEDMIRYGHRVLYYTKGIELEVLITDEGINDGTLHNITLLGSRVAAIPESLRQKHSDVNWESLEKIGDDVITYYWRIDYEAVWGLIQNEIPKMLKALQKMLREMPKGPMLMARVPKREDVGFKDDLPMKQKGPVKRKEVLNVLRAHKKVLKERFGVTKLQLFGSYSRDEAVKGSDVDLLVYFEGDQSHGVSKAQDYIEKLLGLKVDLIPGKELRSEVRPHVEKEAISV